MSDTEWTLVTKEKKNKNVKQNPNTIKKSSSTTDGRNFQTGRPDESTSFLRDVNWSDDNDNDDEDSEENIILEPPIVWHKFALIGDVTSQIDALMLKYRIFPSCEMKKLKVLGRTIIDGNWDWNDKDECENSLRGLSARCQRGFSFISIIPHFTPREYGHGVKLYFVHVRFDQYILAEAKPRIIYNTAVSAYNGFLGEKPTHNPVSNESDSVEENKKIFMQVMKFVEGKMKRDMFQEMIAEAEGNSEKKAYYDPLTKEDLTKYKNSIYTCKLFLEDSYSGYGVVLNENNLEQKIYLHNRRNCYQAFNGDIVKIQVFQQQNAYNKKKFKSKKDVQVQEKEIWSGRVISVEHSEVKPVNKIFLCKLTFGQTNLMSPICKTIPVIDVDNKYAKERVKKECYNLIEGLKDVNGIENLLQRQVKPEFCKSFADKCFITLKTLNDKLETTVSRIQFVDSYRCDFIFLVLYRKWTSDSRFPYGEVVGLYTPDATFQKSLPLIAVSCDLSVVSIEEESQLKPELTRIKVETLRNRQNMNDYPINSDRKVFSFRYSNQPFNEVAYSYENLDNRRFKMGVHVVNVEKYVKKGDFLDKYAMKQFFTFLMPVHSRHGGDVRPLYLFSEALTKEILSINKEHPVTVLSFYFEVDRVNNSIKNDAEMVCEQILLNEEFDVNIIDEMVDLDSVVFDYLRNIYRTCLDHSIRRNRSYCIPPSWFYPDYSFKMDVSAFIISQEMEVLANGLVCQLLSSNRVANYPVKVHEHVLLETKLSSWRHEIRDKLCVKFFPTLNKIFNFNITTSITRTIRFSGQFLDEIVNRKDFNLCKCDMLFPDVSFHFYKLENIVAWNTIMALSDAADSQFTVSITRPLTCFSDLLLQRLLSPPNFSYTDDEIIDVCSIYNDNKLIFEKYWKICRSYEIKEKFRDESFTLDCIYEDFNEESIIFHHVFLRDIYHDNFIPFDCLGLSKVNMPLSLEDDRVEFEWRTRIFIYGDSSHGQGRDRRFSLDDIYNYESILWRQNLNSTEVINTDLVKIADLKSQDKYPQELTSETTPYMDPKISFSLKLTKSQLLRVQFNYDYSVGIMRIIPEILIVNPHLRVCLCHRHDPFKYFVHPSTLSKINYRRFNDIRAYKEQFRSLNRIEGIHQTISERNSYFIHDINITWIGAKNPDGLVDDIYGIVILDQIWCRERFVKLGHKNLRIQDPVNSFKIAVEHSKMEFIACIQSFVDEKKIYWLGHAHISDVAFIGEKTKKKIFLTLKLVHSSFPMVFNSRQLYSLEIMETPITARILDRNLRKLDEDSVAANIVMKKISNAPNDRYTPLNYEVEILAFMEHPYSLNAAQNRAVTIAINREFSLIWGPPGTGKTMVGCIIAYAFTRLNRVLSQSTGPTKKGNLAVLYTGPSNQSVDVVAEKLMKLFGENCPKLLRILSSDIMNMDFPYPGAIVQHETPGTPEFLKKITLHHIVRLPGKPFADKLKQFAEYFRENELRDRVDRKTYSKVVEKYQNKLKSAFQKEIEEGNYEIVLCTTVGSCKKLLDYVTISQVIIDESGMCSEPEALGPILKREHLKNIVFIGDHKQLRPIITSLAAKGKQLNQSLFERVYNPEKNYCTMLDTQYRMHPSICEFPASYFYKDDKAKLITALSESWSGIPNSFIIDRSKFNGLQYSGLRNNYQTELIKNNVNIADNKWKGIRKNDFKCFPIHLDFNENTPVKEKILFVKVEGHEINQAVTGATGNVKSKANELEVIAVTILYKSLIERIQNKSTASQSILILTQYRLQESKLKEACSRILEELKVPGPPLVSTVIRSQGSECDYVIFSTVRSLPHQKDIDINPSPGWIGKYLGFITDKNQLNVAITRAKKGLFIIGNSNLLSVNIHWKTLIQDLASRGCVADTIFDLQ